MAEAAGGPNAGAQEPNNQGPIPKERFDEVNNKRKALEAKVEEYERSLQGIDLKKVNALKDLMQYDPSQVLDLFATSNALNARLKKDAPELESVLAATIREGKEIDWKKIHEASQARLFNQPKPESRPQPAPEVEDLRKRTLDLESQFIRQAAEGDKRRQLQEIRQKFGEEADKDFIERVETLTLGRLAKLPDNAPVPQNAFIEAAEEMASWQGLVKQKVLKQQVEKGKNKQGAAAERGGMAGSEDMLKDAPNAAKEPRKFAAWAAKVFGNP